MADTWLYYRIFVNPSDSGHLADYTSLLRDVVHPVITTFRPHIRHFHFFRYAGAYKDHAEGVEKPLAAAPEEWVHFIRLRVLVEDEQAAQLHSLLQELRQKSGVCKGIEIPTAVYDIEADIGARFGNTRTWEVANLIQAAATLALAYASDGQEYDPHPQGQGGTAGLIHLVANTLFYQVNVYRTDWGRSGMLQLGP